MDRSVAGGDSGQKMRASAGGFRARGVIRVRGGVGRPDGGNKREESGRKEACRETQCA